MEDFNQITEKIIELLEEFNQTGEIDTMSFIGAVEKFLLTKDHVYVVDASGFITDMGELEDIRVDVKKNTVINSITTSRPNGFTKQIRRNSNGSIKSLGPNRFIYEDTRI